LREWNAASRPPYYFFLVVAQGSGAKKCKAQNKAQRLEGGYEVKQQVQQQAKWEKGKDSSTVCTGCIGRQKKLEVELELELELELGSQTDAGCRLARCVHVLLVEMAQEAGLTKDLTVALFYGSGGS
jgi:hypothetical protein